MTTTIARGESAGTRVRQIPGEPGIWVFAMLDMLIFAEMFGIYGYYHADHLGEFLAAQSAMIPAVGLAYTVILMASSWLVVQAISAARKGQLLLADKLVKAGVTLGISFIVLKLIEYSTKVAQGITPVMNDFFMFFFVMTFVHMLHAAVGVGALFYMRRRIAALSPNHEIVQPRQMRIIETCGIYWHMVDLLWIVLFALFYLKG